MKLFQWAKSRNQVVENADLKCMTNDQLIERAKRQRDVIRSQREKIAELNQELKRLKRSGESIVQDIILIRSACLSNYDQLPKDVQDLISEQ